MGWMENDYWTTIDDRKLYPKDFTDQHLLNTINYIEKRASIHKLNYEISLLNYPEPHGDAASYAVESEQIRIERMSEVDWLKCFCNIYSLLLEERDKRQLCQI